jgi:hypothetical protein
MKRTIPAKSKEDAIKEFNQQAHDAFTRGARKEGPQGLGKVIGKMKTKTKIHQIDSDEC